jgi:hypothetical protein
MSGAFFKWSFSAFAKGLNRFEAFFFVPMCNILQILLPVREI